MTTPATAEDWKDSIVALIFLIPLAAEVFFLHRWFYGQLDRECVKELRGGFTRLSVMILSAPFVIFVGMGIIGAIPILSVLLVPLIYAFLGSLYLFMQLFFIMTMHPQSMFAEEWKLTASD